MASRARGANDSWLDSWLPNPLAGPVKVLKRLRSFQKRIGLIGSLALLGTAVITLNGKKTSARLQIMIERQKQKIAAAHALARMREKVIGPLTFAAHELALRIHHILLPFSTTDMPTNNWLLQNYPEKAELTLMSTLFMFCRFIYWQQVLTHMLQAVTTQRDEWQIEVEALNREFMQMWQARDHSTFPIIPMDLGQKDPKRDTSKYLPNNTIVRAEVQESQHTQAKFPFRLLNIELDIIAGCMQIPEKAADGKAGTDTASYNRPTFNATHWTISEFMVRVKRALVLRASRKHVDANVPLQRTADEDDLDGWIDSVLPLWDALVRYNFLLRSGERDAYSHIIGRSQHKGGLVPVMKMYLWETQLKLHDIMVKCQELSALVCNSNAEGEFIEPLLPGKRLRRLPDDRLVYHCSEAADEHWAMLRKRLHVAVDMAKPAEMEEARNSTRGMRWTPKARANVRRQPTD